MADNIGGRQAKCSKCGAVFQSPAAPAPPPLAAATADAAAFALGTVDPADEILEAEAVLAVLYKLFCRKHPQLERRRALRGWRVV
jgi:hypothetical protein